MAAEQKVARKFRAILSADVKGYSRLMEKDETSTIQRLNEYRHIMSEIIEWHTGHVIDTVGDNLLAEFSSAVEAVKCSVEVQKDLKEKNKELPQGSRLEFRTRVHPHWVLFLIRQFVRELISPVMAEVFWTKP